MNKQNQIKSKEQLRSFNRKQHQGPAEQAGITQDRNPTSHPLCSSSGNIPSPPDGKNQSPETSRELVTCFLSSGSLFLSHLPVLLAEAGPAFQHLDVGGGCRVCTGQRLFASGAAKAVQRTEGQ